MSYPSRKAESVIEELQILTIDDLLMLEEIAWARDVLVRYDHLVGAEARLNTVNHPAIATISSGCSKPRQRFSIAHELGHYELHKIYANGFFCNDIGKYQWWEKQTAKDKKKLREFEANQFAANFLLPASLFVNQCDCHTPDFNVISSLAKLFQTSLTATALRYIDFCLEPVVLVFCQNNWIRWFKESTSFEEIRDELGFFIGIHSKVNANTLTGRFFSSGRKPIGKQQVLASDWFISNRRLYPKAKIQEQTVCMPQYNSTLSLLLINEEIGE